MIEVPRWVHELLHIFMWAAIFTLIALIIYLMIISIRDKLRGDYSEEWFDEEWSSKEHFHNGSDDGTWVVDIGEPETGLSEPEADEKNFQAIEKNPEKSEGGNIEIESKNKPE